MAVLLRGCDCSQSAGRRRSVHVRRAAVQVERPPSLRSSTDAPEVLLALSFQVRTERAPGHDADLLLGPWPSTSPERLARHSNGGSPARIASMQGRSFGEGRVPARGGATKEVRRIGSGISRRPRTVSLSTHTAHIKRTHPPCRAPNGRTPVIDRHLTLAALKRASVQRSRGWPYCTTLTRAARMRAGSSPEGVSHAAVATAHTAGLRLHPNLGATSPHTAHEETSATCVAALTADPWGAR